MEHNLLVPYPVLTEKSGEVVAQFKYTVAILQGQTVILSGLSLDETKVVSEHKITEQKILDLLAVNLFIQISMDKKAQKNASKKAKRQNKAGETAEPKTGE